MKVSRVHVKWAVLLCSVGAYIYSLFLPGLLLDADVYHSDNSIADDAAPVVSGTSLLFFGWLGILEFEFAWLANSTNIIAIWAYAIANLDNSKGFSIISIILSVAALLLAITSYYAESWLLEEVGNTVPIIGLGVGFYVWMLSFSLLLIDCIISPRAYSSRAI